MAKYKPPKIEDIGLAEYLGDKYDMFVHLYKSGVNPTNIAKAIDVKSPLTVIKYIEIYKKEKP